MKLKVITSNPGKVREYGRELSAYGIEMEHFPHPYDEIQTSDLEEVVNRGMDALVSEGIRDFIVDDSGLFVDALKGFPGVWSAYAQKTIGNAGILKLLEGNECRGAEFRCCIGCDIAGKRIVVTGICRGTIISEERGTDGFGFDPLFSADGERTFSEIPLDEKNAVSHRGNAIRLLIEALKKEGFARFRERRAYPPGAERTPDGKDVIRRQMTNGTLVRRMQIPRAMVRNRR